jgi:hypothetical protein
MEPTAIFAIGFCASFLAAFLLAHLVPHLRRIAVRAWAFALKNLHYRYAVRRHAWFGPFTISSILAHLVYVGGNVACLCYTGRAVSSTIASRAAILSLINIGPLYLAPHLSFLADLFGVLLTTYRQVHRSCGLVSASLLLAHALAAMRTRSVPLDTWSLACAITVRCSLSPRSASQACASVSTSSVGWLVL